MKQTSTIVKPWHYTVKKVGLKASLRALPGYLFWSPSSLWDYAGESVFLLALASVTTPAMILGWLVSFTRSVGAGLTGRLCAPVLSNKEQLNAD